MKLILILIFSLAGCFTVRNQQEGVVERLGKFNRIAKTGLNFKWPLLEKEHQINLKIQELNIKTEVKTKDDIFVFLKINIQISVKDTYKAFYSLTNYSQQISSYIESSVKAEVSKLTLKAVFTSKEDIIRKIRTKTNKEIINFGYGITKIMIIDIDPGSKIKKIMNQAKTDQPKEIKYPENIEQISSKVHANEVEENKAIIQDRVLKIRRYGRSFTCYEDN